MPVFENPAPGPHVLPAIPVHHPAVCSFYISFHFPFQLFAQIGIQISLLDFKILLQTKIIEFLQIAVPFLIHPAI